MTLGRLANMWRGVPLLLVLLLRDAWRQGVALALHGLALAVSAFLVVLLATIVGHLAREDAAGAPCSGDVRRLELRDSSGALQLAPRVATATFDSGGSLRTYVLGSQRLVNPDAATGESTFVGASDGLLRALCLSNQAGVHNTNLPPGPRGFAGNGVVPPAGVQLVSRIQDFRGISGVGDGAVWVRERDVPWLRLDPENWDEVLMVERGPGQSWTDIEEEVDAFVRARPGLFSPGTEARWVLASGIDNDALQRGVRGLVLLGLVAGGILALVVANLSVYFVGRHPRFAMTATVLSALGLSRLRLLLVAAFEPAFLVILALPAGTWAAKRYLEAQPGFGRVVIDTSPPMIAALLLCLGVGLVAWRRVAATRSSLRPGVGGFRRLSGRLASSLVVVQIAAAVPLVALSLQAGIGWRQAQASQTLEPPTNVWMARWQRDTPAPNGELVEAIKAIERDDPGAAIASSILPLPGGRATAEEAFVVLGGMRLPVARNQASPRFLELAFGVPHARAEAWLGDTRDGTAAAVVSRSLATALSPLPARFALDFSAADSDFEVPHDVVGVVPDVASMWTGKARHAGVVITRWNESSTAMSGVVLIQAPGVPVERFQRVARRLGADLGDVSNAGTAVTRSVQAERQMAEAFGLMAVVGVACMLVGLISVLRGVEVARALEFSVLFSVGASRMDVARIHLRSLAVPAAGGAIVGLGAAALATLLVAGRRPLLEPLVAPACAAALVSVAGLAVLCALASASRVARRNPMPALRSE